MMYKKALFLLIFGCCTSIYPSDDNSTIVKPTQNLPGDWIPMDVREKIYTELRPFAERYGSDLRCSFSIISYSSVTQLTVKMLTVPPIRKEYHFENLPTTHAQLAAYLVACANPTQPHTPPAVSGASSNPEIGGYDYCGVSN